MEVDYLKIVEFRGIKLIGYLYKIEEMLKILFIIYFKIIK